MQTIDKMTRAKRYLVQYQVFISAVATRLIYIEAPVGTMATDMRHVYWDPNFVKNLSVLETAAVIAHEAFHVIFLHGLRRGERDPLLWNLAGDFAINIILREMGLRLPLMGGTESKPGYCYDEKYRDWSVYEIYDDLLKNKDKWVKEYVLMVDADGQPDKDGKDAKGRKVVFGEISDAKGKKGKKASETQKRELEERIKEVVHNAAQAAKQRGELPGCLEGLVEAVGKPKIEWKDYIQSWVSGVTPDNYTWQKPNRRVLGNYGMIMPTIQFNGAGVGVLSVDASGSVTDKELQYYATEIAGIIDMCGPDKLYIIVHDAVVQSVTVWEPGEDFKHLRIKGRGGTCIAPSFKAAAELEDEVNWMVCLTDMGICDYPSPDEAPDYPVLWAATGPDNAPFGTYIPIKDAF